ncbi:putative protein phosphatase 2C 44 [Hibiscus syriacus]|uniref:PPM-type phosphatase domain-containing protein n=1 Tax=Hibiscus syriacus TaxID=106335 RepID=A0A6A3BJD2_HIBSY|nr:putative protein phosphatase 2C 44 [Hibiscus syriacus]
MHQLETLGYHNPRSMRPSFILPSIYAMPRHSAHCHDANKSFEKKSTPTVHVLTLGDSNIDQLPEAGSSKCWRFPAVICKNGGAKQLSVDHEPASERESIGIRGGFVSNFPGDVTHVDGQLAVARAFGDKNLKKHLTSEPDLITEMINDDTELIILANDGLWKVMSNQEAVDAIKGDSRQLLECCMFLKDATCKALSVEANKKAAPTVLARRVRVAGADFIVALVSSEIPRVFGFMVSRNLSTFVHLWKLNIGEF